MSKADKIPAPDDSDRPNKHHWPPILYGVVIAATWIFERLLQPPGLLPPDVGKAVGWPLFALGLGIGVAALLRFRAVGTAFDPTAPATNLATGGLYQYTRNPMYLGAVIGFFGFGLAWPATSLLILCVPLIVGLIKLAIEPEEAYLERRFGDDYRAYKTRVRRWL